MYISKYALTSTFFYLFTQLFIFFYFLHHAVVSLQVWIMIRACRIKLNPRPSDVVHPLGLVIRQEYLARACSRTNYQAVSLVCPHPHSPRKWGASSKMHVDGRDSGAKEGQEWSHLDMINTETELNLSDTTGQCCKLQQASAHLHQVIEEGVLPTHILQSVWCVSEVCVCGKALLTLHSLRQLIFRIYTITAWKRREITATLRAPCITASGSGCR